MSAPETIQKRWREMMQAKLANVKNIKQLEGSDPNVKRIMETLRSFYQHKIDVVPVPELTNTGGHLLGHYVSVATTSSIKRAERDAAEQCYEEILSSLTLMNRNDEVGVTEARSMAKEQMGEFATEIVWREQHKNAYEAIVDSTEKTISFIQSIIKTKLNERASGKLADETT